MKRLNLLRSRIDLGRYISGEHYLCATLILLVFGLTNCKSPATSEEKRSQSLRIISYNVWYGFTKAPDRKLEWIQWMQDQAPDVVSLQELNGYTSEQLGMDAANWDHSYTTLLKEDGFPTGVTSRYPIQDIKKITEGFHHGLLRVKIRNIYFYIIHLHPSNWQVRHREIDAIQEDVQLLGAEAKVILAGDFNTFSARDSTYYHHGRLEPFFSQRDQDFAEQNLSLGGLDYGVLDKVYALGMLDTELHLRPDNYIFTGSFPTQIEKDGEHGDLRRLDYIFISDNLKSNLRVAQIVSSDLTQMLSDHLPVCVDLEID